MSRTVVLSAVVVVAAGTALVFAFQNFGRAPSADSKVATPTPAAPQAQAQVQAPAALAAVQAETTSIVAALGASPAKPEADDGAPSFDIARIEPTGEAVIAGRAAPGATVELLRDGKVHESTVADQAGQFVMVPPRLPAGSYDLTLRAKQPDGKQATSKQRVAVAFEASPKEQPVVALMTPNKPTVVLSQSAAAKSTAGTVAVDAVEVEPGGKFHVSGRGRPGAAMRFYLNDSFVASVTAGAEGRFSVTINEGIAPGNYRVRLDEVEPTSGSVRARAEVPFNVPDTLITSSVPAQSAASKRMELASAPPAAAAASKQPAAAAAKPSEAVASKSSEAAAAQPQAAAATAPPDKGSPSAVVVPKIVTATVARGDSLWAISSVTYGAGVRYAVIYKANQEQIRNPNLIYPGQVFVLPTQ